MKFNPVEHAAGIIKRIPYLTLATSDKNCQPWNSPVYFAYNSDYHFFWSSSPTARHSENISENKQVFAVIYDSTVADATGEGVYIEGVARELTSKEDIKEGLKLIYGRKGHDPKPVEHFMDRNPRRVYKLIPSRFWINRDERFGGYHVDMRMEVRLP